MHGIKFSPEAIASAVLNIYKGKINVDKELEPALFAETVSIFNRALSTGFADALQNGAPLPPDSFTELVKSNIEVFSAFRVHRMQKDIAALMVGDDGKLKPFSQFAKDVKPYVSHQNRVWLETEYNTAVHRAQLASEWQQFVRDADVLPNLRWVPTTSPNIGEDHRVFWNVIRPVGDSFWSVHRPGDRWNCKCSLEQTDKDITPVPNGSIEKGSTPSRGLDNNPGKDGKLFNEKHPYFPHNCSSCPFKSANLSALFHSLAAKKDCFNCKYINGVINQKNNIKSHNRNIYNILSIDDNYTNVKYDKKSGGVRATHKNHTIHTKKEKTFFGYTSSELENHCLDILYKNGNICILNNENELDGKGKLPALDVTLNDILVDIASITSKRKHFLDTLNKKENQILRYVERRNITNDIPDSVCLYFEDQSLFSETKIKRTIKHYIHRRDNFGKPIKYKIKNIYCVINDGTEKGRIIQYII